VVIAWLCVIAPFFSFFPALAGVLMASAALRRIGQEPDRPGKRAAIGVIIAGVLAMLASAGITILLYW